MERLNYSTLKQSGYYKKRGFLLEEAPERVLQIGEGNFLRAFADYFIDVANEKAEFNSKVVVVQPIQNGLAQLINEQQGLYTLYLRGMENGEKVEEKRIISCISRALNPYENYNEFLKLAHNPELRYIISNTTEAGITFDTSCTFDDAPPSSFPAKLTRFLYERYKLFSEIQKAEDKGFAILACELIDYNGHELKHCVEKYIKLWNLEDNFLDWAMNKNLFCSTLVDRIVTGYPHTQADELNTQNEYEDKLLNTGEIFGLWVIEAPESLANELPFERAGLPVKVVTDHTPYKQCKVRILNGVHTSTVPAAFLSGKNIVRECVEDSTLYVFMKKTIEEEIIPTLTLPKQELDDFAHSVMERFANPFIDHSLLSITLNSVSKWKARVLPSLKGYVGKFNKLPPYIVFGFSAYVAFVRAEKLENGILTAKHNEQQYSINDDIYALQFFYEHRNDSNVDFVSAICANEQLWGENLHNIEGFAEAVTKYVNAIGEIGTYAALQAVLDGEQG